VVDSGGANISSVLHALRRLGAEPVFSADAAIIRRGGRVILPGVGAAGHAMTVLRGHGLVEVIRRLTQPVLGICLGMQLLFESSAEDQAEMLGLIPARLTRLDQTPQCRVPHMGWNRLQRVRPDPCAMPSMATGLFRALYAAPLGDWTLASSTHGQAFSAVVRQETSTAHSFTRNARRLPAPPCCKTSCRLIRIEGDSMHLIPAIDLLRGRRQAAPRRLR
jgi:glutamine amidotransferase